MSGSGGSCGDAGWRWNFDLDIMEAVHAVEATVPLLEVSDTAAMVVMASAAAVATVHDGFPAGVLQAYGAMQSALTPYVVTRP